MNGEIKPWDLPDFTRVDAALTRASAGSDADHMRAIRAQAERNGFNAGAEEARKQSAATTAAAVEQFEQAQRCNVAIQEAVAQLKKADALSAEEAGREAVELAYRLCEQILEKELSRDGAVMDAVQRATALLPSRDSGVLRVSPRDVEQVKEALKESGLKVIGDDTVLPGGCVAEAGQARVDVRWEAALIRVREVLELPPL
jgi:flagellar biosynthesis/type III secretory pathway protein FliH